MSTEAEVKIVAAAEVRDADAFKRLTADVRRLQQQLQKLGTAGVGKIAPDLSGLRGVKDTYAAMGRQRAGDRAADAAGESDMLAAVRRRMDFMARMTAQRLREEAAGRRADEQHQARMMRARQEATGRARGALDAGRGAVDRVSRGTILAAGLSAAAITAAVRKGLNVRGDADAAETRATTFGGMTPAEVKHLRSGWGDRNAIKYGLKPGDTLDAFTETIKAGIPRDFSAKVSESIMGAVAGLDLDMPDTTKLVGRLSTLTQDPKKFRPEAIDGMLNSIAVVAKSTAADSREIVSSLRRGAGVLGASKMSVGDLTAFTGTAISAGMQEGKAGTFMDYMVNELVGAKNEKGKRRSDLGKAFGMLGLGGAGSVSAQAANDPTKLLTNVFGRLEAMPEQKRAQVADLIGRREWRGEILQITKAFPILKQALADLADPSNATFLDKAAKAKLLSMRGLSASLRAITNLAWESFGAGFEGLYREAVTFFVGRGSGFPFDTITKHVRAFLDGLKRGFDLSSWTEGLEKLFGGSMSKGGWQSTLFEFARGFAEGLRAIADTIGTVATAIGGGQLDARALGRWTSEFLGLAVAARVASPVLGVLGAVGSMLTGLATAALALRGLGLGGIAASLSPRLAMGLRAGLIGVVGVAAGYILDAVGEALLTAAKARVTAFMIGFREEFSTRLQEGFDQLLEVWKNMIPAWVRSIGDMIRTAIMGGTDSKGDAEEGQRLRDLDKMKRDEWRYVPPKVELQNYGGSNDNAAGGYSGLVHKAALGGVERAVEKMSTRFDQFGAKVEFASLGGGSKVDWVARNARNAALPRGAGGGATVVGPSAPGLRELGYRDRFRVGGPASSPGAVGSGVPRIRVPSIGGAPADIVPPRIGGPTGTTKEVLDHIASGESSRKPGGGYNVTLANGRLLPGGRETNLTGMTLDQVDALQTGMLRNPANRWNSSAAGRYQIVRTTLRGLRRKMGLNGSELYDEAMQDRLALQLWNDTKGNRGRLANEWESFRGGKLDKAVDLYQRWKADPGTLTSKPTIAAAGRPAVDPDRFKSSFPSAQELFPSTPLRSSPLQAPTVAPQPGGTSGGGNVQIHVNGAGQDAETIASSVQRRFRDESTWRTHDLEFGVG